MQVPEQFPLTDKIVHVFEYSLLGILVARALLNTTPWTRRIVFLVAIMVCFLYGLTDEYHQSFVPGRDSSIFDALADFFGANIGAGVYLLILSKYFKAIRHSREGGLRKHDTNQTI